MKHFSQWPGGTWRTERMRKRLLRQGSILLLSLCMGLSACTAGTGTGPQIHIKGKAFGEALDLGVTRPVPVQARVTCNNASVVAAADGTFDLTLTQAKAYRCTASAPPAYQEQSATFSGDLGKVISLNFDNSGQEACATFPSSADI